MKQYTEEEQKANFEISNKFLGYGDPEKSIIYFFGIEDGSAFTKPEEFDKWFIDIKKNINFPTDKEYSLYKDYRKIYWSCSDNKRIWFVGHPSNGWFDERVSDRIINFLTINK